MLGDVMNAKWNGQGHWQEDILVGGRGERMSKSAAAIETLLACEGPELEHPEMPSVLALAMWAKLQWCGWSHT